MSFFEVVQGFSDQCAFCGSKLKSLDGQFFRSAPVCSKCGKTQPWMERKQAIEDEGEIRRIKAEEARTKKIVAEREENRASNLKIIEQARAAEMAEYQFWLVGAKSKRPNVAQFSKVITSDLGVFGSVIARPYGEIVTNSPSYVGRSPLLHKLLNLQTELGQNGFFTEIHLALTTTESGDESGNKPGFFPSPTNSRLVQLWNGESWSIPVGYYPDPSEPNKQLFWFGDRWGDLQEFTQELQRVSEIVSRTQDSPVEGSMLPESRSSQSSFQSLEALERLAALLDRGLLTQEEFESQKRRILDS